VVEQSDLADPRNHFRRGRDQGQSLPVRGQRQSLDVEAMLAVLNEAPKGDVVLLHACCHNPTGFDLSHDDWRACWTLSAGVICYP
jgi:DNA-binding transcriptional MocR family regulator